MTDKILQSLSPFNRILSLPIQAKLVNVGRWLRGYKARLKGETNGAGHGASMAADGLYVDQTGQVEAKNRPCFRSSDRPR